MLFAIVVAVTGYYFGKGMHIHTLGRWLFLGLVLYGMFGLGYMLCYSKCSAKGHHDDDPRY